MPTTWTNGDVSGSQTLTDNDHLYPAHVNEIRTAINTAEAAIDEIETDWEVEHNTDGTHKSTKVAGIDGWVQDSDTWVYVSVSSFKIVGKDVTAKFPKGTKIKLTQTSAKYFYVTAASFSTDTTVTITGGTAWEYSLANAAITSPYYSYMATPQGFPEEGLNYTPTISTTADCGTLTLCRAQINNNQVIFKGRITYAKALASGNLTLSLPVDCIFSLVPIGFAHYFDGGVADKRAFVNTPSTSTINFYLTDGNSDFTGTFVNSSNWSSGDWVDWVCSYPWIA